MTVFKAFLQVLNRCKGTVIMYTVILVSFGVINMANSEQNMGFEESKPRMLVINQDAGSVLSEDMYSYLENHADFIKVDDNEEAISDALFYRDVNYIVYIPENFQNDILEGKTPEVSIRSTNDYSANYSEMLVKKYISAAQCYAEMSADENELIQNIASTLGMETAIEVTSKLDSSALTKTATFFNFMNYGLLAGAIFTICTIISSFNEKNIRRRTIVSSIKQGRYNRILLMSNSIFAVVLWIAYIVFAFIICKTDTMASKHGLMFMLNSFVFMICTVTIAFLLSSLVNNKNALNGIVNVIALGSSFLCGAFVPTDLLPDSVLNIAHILPSYWYIQTNEALKTLEKWDADSLKPLFVNMTIILGFSVLFVVISNIISAKKRKIN